MGFSDCCTEVKTRGFMIQTSRIHGAVECSLQGVYKVDKNQIPSYWSNAWWMEEMLHHDRMRRVRDGAR